MLNTQSEFDFLTGFLYIYSVKLIENNLKQN